MNEFPKKKYVTNADGTYSEVLALSGDSIEVSAVDDSEVDGSKSATKALFAEADSVSTRGIINHFSGQASSLNGEILTLKTVGYAWIRLQILGTWVGTISFQGSMDGWTWSTIGLNDANQLGSFPLSNVTSNRLLYGPVNYNYLRVYFSAYTSGTANALVSLDGQSPGTLVIGGAVGISNSPSVALNSGTISYTNQSVAIAPRGSQPTLTSVTANGADLLASTDVISYSSATITVAGTWSGTLSVQFSDDNGGFTTAPCVYPISGPVQDTITANGQYVIKGFFGRYMRIRSTTWSSGTATATLTFHTKENNVVNQQGVRQSGNWNFNTSASVGQNTVNVTTSNTTIANANGSRKGLIISNTGSVAVSINLTGATATAGMLTLPANSQPFKLLSYVPLGAITAIAASGSSDVSVTELF